MGRQARSKAGKGKAGSGRKPAARERGRVSFADAVRSANRRACERASGNRKAGRREMKTVRATIAATEEDEDFESGGMLRKVLRWLAAAVLLPLCWVTMWTLLSRFSEAALNKGFWQSSELWYFGTGAVWMVLMFWSGLLERVFLYLYVLGHELTHAAFVICFWGRVSKISISSQGGYITTNKTNIIIALSPYVVPFWSVVVTVLFLLGRVFFEPTPRWDLAFYLMMGGSWAFHIIWTIWMLPRDQPDLKENGTFLSLVIIYMANLLALAGLLCLAADAPLENAREFAREWVRHAVTWVDFVWRWGVRTFVELRAAARL